MQSHSSTTVPRVQCGKQWRQFGASTFTQYQAICTHPESLRHQHLQGDSTHSLDVGLLRLKTDHVRMGYLKFSYIFENNNALLLRGSGQ
jgi:hypothetical protein